MKRVLELENTHSIGQRCLCVVLARCPQTAPLAPETEDIESSSLGRKRPQEHDQTTLRSFDPGSFHAPTAIDEEDVLLGRDRRELELWHHGKLHRHRTSGTTLCEASRRIQTF